MPAAAAIARDANAPDPPSPLRLAMATRPRMLDSATPMNPSMPQPLHARISRHHYAMRHPVLSTSSHRHACSPVHTSSRLSILASFASARILRPHYLYMRMFSVKLLYDINFFSHRLERDVIALVHARHRPTRAVVFRDKESDSNTTPSDCRLLAGCGQE
jgi:hypothetical protein